MTAPKIDYEFGILNGTTESPKIGVYETSTEKAYKLGSVLRTPDGKTFRYAKAGAAALVAGDLIQQATLAGATTTAQTSLAVATAGVIGDNFAYATIATTIQPEDTFRDGWYVVENQSAALGFGTMYQIDAHDALAVATNKIPLQETLRTATDTSTTVRLIANPYQNVIQAPVTTVSGSALGVAQIAVPAENYFWLQTYGEVSALCSGTMTVGTAVVRAVAVAGAIGPRTDGLIVETVGYALATIATSEAGPIMLMIFP
jgi:hypothetical protein